MTPLRKARRDMGHTLVEVEYITGVKFGYISELERGIKINPSIKVARALSKFYNMTIDELFPEEENIDESKTNCHVRFW